MTLSPHSYRHRIIGDVRYARNEKARNAHPYHDFPDELLTEVFTSDPVDVITRRLLHPRLAYVYLPLLMSRHPVDSLTVMKGFAKTYLALHTDLVTPETIITPAFPAFPRRLLRSRREVQVSIRRKAWRKTWRAENPIAKGDARVVGSFAKYALYAFLVQTVEAFAEPTGEEFWEEFQLELCKRQERAHDSSRCVLAAARLHNLQKNRFDRLQVFLAALKHHLPVAINGMFTREHAKVQCERFMADIFHRLVCHFIAQQRKWHSYYPYFTLGRPLAVRFTELRRQHDNVQLALAGAL